MTPNTNRGTLLLFISTPFYVSFSFANLLLDLVQPFLEQAHEIIYSFYQTFCIGTLTRCQSRMCQVNNPDRIQSPTPPPVAFMFRSRLLYCIQKLLNGRLVTFVCYQETRGPNADFECGKEVTYGVNFSEDVFEDSDEVGGRESMVDSAVFWCRGCWVLFGGKDPAYSTGEVGRSQGIGVLTTRYRVFSRRVVIDLSCPMESVEQFDFSPEEKAGDSLESRSDARQSPRTLFRERVFPSSSSFLAMHSRRIKLFRVWCH